MITELYMSYDDGLDNLDLLERSLTMIFVAERRADARPEITVLDRLRDRGSHLTKLGLCLDLEDEWVGPVRIRYFTSAKFRRLDSPPS